MRGNNLTLGRRFLRKFGSALIVVAVSLIVTLVPVRKAWAAGNYKTLHRFTAGTDGALVYGGLILDGAGNLYGTTARGGTGAEGTVFKLAPNANGGWTKSVLYNFCSRKNCADGTDPQAGLVFDQAGNLYGTTVGGGTQQEGTVFELTPNGKGGWTESVLYNFCSHTNCEDGALPQASLVLDRAGNLFGTTLGGGNRFQAGTVFELTPNGNGGWTENVLFSFCSRRGCGDGGAPQAGLVFDKVGNLYGTTKYGGLGKNGTVFKLTPQPDGSWKESVLYKFRDEFDGKYPLGGLIFDAASHLYGTTSSSVSGVVFRLSPASHGMWKEKVLHIFSGKDGDSPVAALISDSAGNLYGTTLYGGDLSRCSGMGCGVVFKLAHNSKSGWRTTVLHRFLDHPGAFPFAGLTLDAAGNLYGTTEGDQTTTFGSVFEITP